MSERCTVLIASADRLPTCIAQRGDGGEILAFTDADALRALDAITGRRPALVILDRTFASTARGAALINRIKADPSLSQTQIELVSAEDESTPVPPRGPSDRSGDVAAAPAPQPREQPDRRRASRVKTAASTEVRVDGQRVALVDVSPIGAQIISMVALKPNKRVRLVLADAHGAVRCTAVVTRASLETGPQSGLRYRVGLEFRDADPAAVAAYCSRQKAL